MDENWRRELSDDVRKQLATEMCVELLRVTGENDTQKVSNSVAKFELMMWTHSSDRNTYMTKMQRKIENLRRRLLLSPVQAADEPSMVAPPQDLEQQVAQAMRALTTVANVNVNMNAMRQQQRPLSQAFQAQTAPFLSQQYIAGQATAVVELAAIDLPANVVTTPGAPAVTESSPVASNTTAAAAGLTPQQGQQWLQQLQAQFQVQQEDLERAHKLEMGELYQKQLQQQREVSQQQQQPVLPEARLEQLEKLQEQHEMERARFRQMQEAKHQQLRRKQQQCFMQKQQQLEIMTRQTEPAMAANGSDATEDCRERLGSFQIS